MRTLLSELVAIHVAQENCREVGNDEWFDKHSEHLAVLADNLPSGNGFNAGTKIVLLSDTKAIFLTSFYHMDEWGGYDGWTEHEVTVIPTFNGFSVTVSGKNKNDIKEYIAEEFHYLLNENVTENGRLASLVEAQEKWKERIADGLVV